MKIHLVSDLHLAFGHETLPGGADLLLVAGDTIEIKQLKQAERFFKEEVVKYPSALFVCGNHEFYGMQISEALEALHKAMPSNSTLLENNYVRIDGWTFAGCTLWTDINKRDPLTASVLRSNMNDFKTIKFSKEPFVRFTPTHAANLHAVSKKFISNLAKVKEKVFVVTHHAPCFKSISPEYVHEHLMNGGYASDLSDLILNNPSIKYWVHGHIHYKNDYMIGQCRVLSNPRGYYGHESMAKTFKPLEILI